MSNVTRCTWSVGRAETVTYHDQEWGRPTTNDRRLFEKVCLEGFQSGLSWLTILRKRDRFREVFADFDFEVVASFGEADVQRLLDDPGIIRHRGKIEATINNARRACEMVDSDGSVVDWMWQWALTEPERHDGAIPSKTDRSARLAAELKQRGWKFFGPTTAYAFMQSEGLTNDHDPSCFVFDQCELQRREFLDGRVVRPSGT